MMSKFLYQHIVRGPRRLPARYHRGHLPDHEPVRHHVLESGHPLLRDNLLERAHGLKTWIGHSIVSQAPISIRHARALDLVAHAAQ